MEHAKKHGTSGGYFHRLAKLISDVGGNNDAARIMDKSVKSIERYKAGSEAPFDAIHKLVTAAGASLDWLATGEQVKREGTEGEDALNQEHISKYMVNLDTVQAAVEALERHVSKQKKKIDPKKKANIIVLMCQIATEEGEIDETNLIRLTDIAG